MTYMMSPTPTRKYDLGFARWVYQHIDGGERLALCMQCGVCSGSCPLGTTMDNGPRKTFMMIRAGMKDDVLRSDTLWNCVSCYNCVVRCPRDVPVAYILHELSTVAVREGYAQAKMSETNKFVKGFTWSFKTLGRTDERLVSLFYYFQDGFVSGLKKLLVFRRIAFGFVKAGRLPIGMPHSIRHKGELRKILTAAATIEAHHAKGEK
ncbi:CoB--CoM heterodisulfide reductase subunit C [invertebrate metagenome]|uniref:CoB--CoM heterodisulfide reductase subunit C n=1 Tax=invertebrate metagenome TaxID=1711999 RepID=A0A484H7L3_9ZZZZ